MSNKLKIGLAAVIAILLMIVILDHLPMKAITPVAGGTAQNCGGSVTCFTDLAANNLFAATEMWFTGSTDATAKAIIVSVGTLNTGTYAASSTVFAVANPFAATSTAEIEIKSGTGQATSTTLSVATSSPAMLAAGLARTGANSLGPTSLINSATIATSSAFDLFSGISTGSVSAISPGSGSVAKVIVGPNDSIAGFATSTAVGSAAANYTPGITGTYVITWSR